MTLTTTTGSSEKGRPAGVSGGQATVTVTTAAPMQLAADTNAGHTGAPWIRVNRITVWSTWRGEQDTSSCCTTSVV